MQLRTKQYFQDQFDILSQPIERIQESITQLCDSLATLPTDHPSRETLQDKLDQYTAIKNEKKTRKLRKIEDYDLTVWQWRLLVIASDYEIGVYVKPSQKIRWEAAAVLKTKNLLKTDNPKSEFWFSLTQKGIQALNTFLNESPLLIEAIYRQVYNEREIKPFFIKQP